MNKRIIIDWKRNACFGDSGYGKMKYQTEVFLNACIEFGYKVVSCAGQDAISFYKSIGTDREEYLLLSRNPEAIRTAEKAGIQGILIRNTVQMMQDVMDVTGREFFDIMDDKGVPTGQIKERTLVHQKGDIHGTSHVWIGRTSKDNFSGVELLLQKRSAEKDSHPGCYDTSSAGHIPAGQGYLESALRELQEELGLTAAPDDLTCISLHEGDSQAQFYGKPFNNHEISKVYVYQKPLDIKQLTLQKEEVESVCWMDAEIVMERLKAGDKKFCMYLDEVEMVVEYFRQQKVSSENS